MIESYTSTNDVFDIMEECSADFHALVTTIAREQGKRLSATELCRMEDAVKAALPKELHLTFTRVCDRYGEDSLHYAQAGYLLGLAIRDSRHAMTTEDRQLVERIIASIAAAPPLRPRSRRAA